MSDETNNLNVKIKVFADFGIELSCQYLSLQDWKFDALTQCIKRNRENGAIEVVELNLDKHQTLHMKIKGVTKETLPEFVTMLSNELLEVIQPQYVKENMFNKIENKH